MKIRWPYGRVGSSPTIPTSWFVDKAKLKIYNVLFVNKTTNYKSEELIFSWGMGLHGVVICFAHRKSDEFDSRILHHARCSNGAAGI